MCADEDYDEDIVYKLRNHVHYLGSITIYFHENIEEVKCICSRVLVLRPPKSRIKKSNIRTFNYLQPKTDYIEFPVCKIAHPDCNVMKNSGNSSKQIFVDSTCNSDENHLITSDTDEETTCCCCFGKMFHNLCKKLRIKKRKRPTDDEKDVEASTSNKPSVAPEPFIPNGGAPPLTTDSEDDDSPLEYSSKYLDNGITHMGYAFKKPKSTSISRICWEYNVNRINQWNEALTLQTPIFKPLSAASNELNNDNFLVPDHVPSVNLNASVDGVDDEQIEIGKQRRNNGKKKKKKTGAVPEIKTQVTFEPKTEIQTRIIIKAKRSTKTKAQETISTEVMPIEITNDPVMRKYWAKRYRLFSKFDYGIRLDTESWYSVTPEKISEHIADRCRCDVIIDGFCGAGGNTIQFAFTCERVIAIDIDPKKIELAKHNARIYNVEDRIEFIVGDFFKVVPTLKADVVFLSPPWGGPLYNRRHSFALHEICPPYGGKAIFDVALRVSENIAFYLPRNINTCDLMTLHTSNQTLELEQSLLENKLVAVTAYFGGLVINESEM